MALDFGGDDITQFLHTLLLRTGLPYRDADLSRWYDFTILEDLKERMVVLSEVCLRLLFIVQLAADPHRFAGRRRSQPLRFLRPRTGQADKEVQDEDLR